MTLIEKILEELRRGDRFASELKDALQIGYSELWQEIALLQSQGQVFSYFKETPPSATLTYTLIRPQKPKSIITPWKPLEQEINSIKERFPQYISR